MAILDPGHWRGKDGLAVGRAALSRIFRGIEVVAIDDVGTEEIPYKGRNEGIARVNRYGEFVDFCLTNKISIVLSSMVPIINVRKDAINSDFLDIIGPKAFDRLWQISKGDIWHFQKTKSYRREL